jgi:hypothetical protein
VESPQVFVLVQGQVLVFRVLVVWFGVLLE